MPASIPTEHMKTFTGYMKASILLRLVAGPAVFFFPLASTLVNVLLDAFDGELYKQSGYARPQYSTYDKLLDYYWYLWLMAYIMLANIPGKWLFLGLFAYRTVGQILFLMSRNGMLLFLFPNVFEKLFFYYLLARTINEENLLMGTPYLIGATAVITVISVVLEYVIHLKRMNFSGTYLGKTTFWSPKTLNPYKAFVFFSLMLTTGIILTRFLDTKTSQTITSKAAWAGKNGVITSYAPDGSIGGTLRSATDRTVTGYLFYSSDFRDERCTLSDIPLTLLRDAQTGTVLYGFDTRNTCLGSLTDGTYWLLLISKKDKLGGGTLIEFRIRDGQLVR